MRKATKPRILGRLTESIFKPSIKQSIKSTKESFKAAGVVKEMIKAKGKVMAGPFGVHMKKMWTGGGSIFKYVAPVFDIAVGILKVLEGAENLEPQFNHQIIAASRALSKEIDDLCEAYYELLDEDEDQTESKTHYIYSMDVEVGSGNWDYKSGAYFILHNGEKQCDTKGNGVTSLADGWVTLNMSNSNTLRSCLMFQFYESNLNVSVVSEQNSHLRDEVLIKRIQVSVDGNYLPSFEAKIDTAVAGERRTEFFPFEPMEGLKAIYSHTSELWRSGTDADVYMMMQLDGEKPSGYFPLDNKNYDDRERGSHDIYRGTTLDDYNKYIRDYIDFWPEEAKIKITIHMVTANTVAEGWNTDLLKLYFTGRTGQNVVIRCIAGGEWIYPTKLSKARKFECKKLEQNHASQSIEMFEAHTCDLTYSGSDSKSMRLKFCKNETQFKSFTKSTSTSDCCTTNYFKLDSTRNTYKKYDQIESSTTLDGGAVLGMCEGFDLLGSAVYVAFDNSDGDMGCFDELNFYGQTDPTKGSTTDLPFASCHFNPVKFDLHEVRQKMGHVWTSWSNHMNMPVRCDFSRATNTITRLNVKICERKGDGSKDPMLLRLQNDDEEDCETEGLSVDQKGHFLQFGSASLGSCKNFRVTQTTKAWLSNAGNDDLCITDLYIDAANQSGETKMLRCRYDNNVHYR